MCVAALYIADAGEQCSPLHYVSSRVSQQGRIEGSPKTQEAFLAVCIRQTFPNKCYLLCVELQRFCLDPAAASPCDLLACFATPRKFRLRATPFAQDDTDGNTAQHHSRKQRGYAFMNRGMRTTNGRPYIMCHPDRGNKTEWRDLQKRKKRFWRFVYAELFQTNVTCCAWNCNAFA